MYFWLGWVNISRAASQAAILLIGSKNIAANAIDDWSISVRVDATGRSLAKLFRHCSATLIAVGIARTEGIMRCAVSRSMRR